MERAEALGGERGRGMRCPRKEEARERIHDTTGSEGGKAPEEEVRILGSRDLCGVLGWVRREGARLGELYILGGCVLVLMFWRARMSREKGKW